MNKPQIVNVTPHAITMTNLESGEVYSVPSCGTVINARAYKGRVVAMVAAPGFERKPPEEKRMRDDKFTIF